MSGSGEQRSAGCGRRRRGIWLRMRPTNCAAGGVDAPLLPLPWSPLTFACTLPTTQQGLPSPQQLSEACAVSSHAPNHVPPCQSGASASSACSSAHRSIASGNSDPTVKSPEGEIEASDRQDVFGPLCMLLSLSHHSLTLPRRIVRATPSPSGYSCASRTQTLLPRHPIGSLRPLAH